MISRTRVPRWAPSFGDAMRLAWRPALVYTLFCALGSLVMLLTAAWYDRTSSGKDVVILTLGLTAGMAGVVVGQLLAILRLRAMPIFIVTFFCGMIAAWMMSFSHAPGGEYIAVPVFFFLFAFPCGLLALMHRYDLFASFWPAVGWIGGAFIILNEESRLRAWRESKITAWLPVPLIYLGCFLVFWLLYLAAKQAARVEMWQALSGSAARRVTKKTQAAQRVSAMPRRNLIPLLILAALLFAGSAVLAPYLWRTGKGDQGGQTDGEPKERPRPPDIDGEGLMKQLQKIADEAKAILPKLWPLLLLIILYRPVKRAFLLTHLKAPITPTPPSERIDNLWEYVRIAAEDAGVVPASADSVEQLMKRMVATGRSSPALEKSAEIYIRTRYGFTVQRGDAIAMRGCATEAAKAFRKDLSTWSHVKNWWRPLS